MAKLKIKSILKNIFESVITLALTFGIAFIHFIVVIIFAILTDRDIGEAGVILIITWLASKGAMNIVSKVKRIKVSVKKNTTNR